MKLKRKHKFLKIILILIFMFFICYKTINYLYKNNSISTSEYVELLLSDAYENDFYKKTVDMFSKNFNPFNVIELREIHSKNLSSFSIINKPIIYLINSNQDLYYKSEFGFKPDVLLSTYLLNENLNKIGVPSIYENTSLKEFSSLNDIESPLDLLVSTTLDNNPSIKHIINIGVSNIKEYDEAYIYIYINESNIDFMKKLNNHLNKIKPGISKMYYEEGIYNHIDIGCSNNSMKEVVKSIKILGESLKEVIDIGQ